MNLSIFEIAKTIVLGIVQGLTEFLPVSSSGHLVIIPFLFNWSYIPLYFTITLHFATLLSLVVVFYKDIWRIILAFFKGLFIKSFRKDNNFKLSIFIIIGSIPAAIAGFLLEKYIENFFSKPLYVGFFLLVTALLLVISDYFGRKNENNYLGKNENKKILPSNFNYLNVLIIGIGQAIAILPGISRSGATISFARFFGIKRQECVKFSFLLSIPTIFGAFVMEIIKSFSEISAQTVTDYFYIIISFIFSFASGIFAIKFLLRLAQRKNLNYFAIYCVALAVFIFILVFIRNL